MKEKSKEKVELCAVSKETVQKRLDALVKNPASKSVLDEYFMWVAILNSPIDIVEKSPEPEAVEAE
jgi:hypothetical protein